MTESAIHGDTSIRQQRTPERLVGRESELDLVHHVLSSPEGARLICIRGEPGIGRSTFLRSVHRRLRAEATNVLYVACRPGDNEHPLLLALRLIMILLKPQPSTVHHQSAGKSVGDLMSATEQGDRAAAAKSLSIALMHCGPTVLIVDDLKYGDADSLAIISEIDVARINSDVRIVVSTSRSPHIDEPNLPRHLLAEGDAAKSINLARLHLDDIETVLTHRLQSTPGNVLIQRTYELTQGVPGAIDALLTAWTQQDAIRMIEGHAFLAAAGPAPPLPDDAPFLAPLRMLGETCRGVAGALSVLWPLGLSAVDLIASSIGLSLSAVSDAIRDLTKVGILEESCPNGTAAAGWMFRVPLMAYAVEARLGPMKRTQFSSAVVKALWDTPQKPPGSQRPAILLPGPHADFYLADRIAEADPTVDRNRAAAQLTGIAQRHWPDPRGRGMLRWFQAAARLIEDPVDRAPALLQQGKAAYVSGDYAAARRIAESLLLTPPNGVTISVLQDIASVLASAAAAQRDWPFLVRMATSRWWDNTLLPVEVTAGGIAAALCHLGRWREALDLLSQTETARHTTPDSRSVPVLHRYHGVAELMLGHPQLFTRSLTMTEPGDLPPDLRYELAVAPCEQLLCSSDLQGANARLDDRGLEPEALPPYSLFLWHYLGGRWGEALKCAQWLLATEKAFTSVTDIYLLPARTVDILIAQGNVNNAQRLIDNTRHGPDGPLEHSLDNAQAHVLRALGDPSAAVKALRRGLKAASARSHVYGTDELWAQLTEIHIDAGRISEAMTCLIRLHKVAKQLDCGRSALLYLLASARVLRREAPDYAWRNLQEALDLARSRAQPFETAITLSAAAAHGAGPATLLHEAYELYKETGAPLWRFRTRTALREAGLNVPGREETTKENEHLLATLIAEGLTNRQIATVLRLSEKAIADRISRLLARAGLRSRAEVVTAVLAQDR
ncbi:AAA family ATPase [Streptomyces sp. NPDC048663]|uniref:AAA family ATPase n=1 Tax=Streptomyces sp. NPDC048663 TaxID=3155638 RepID=UPI00341D5DE0